MADDLYTELLGIPPGPRPPNHYALLGLPLFEHDTHAIHEAVLTQTAQLKRYALHPDPDRMRRVQELLNEVNGAGATLQDPNTKVPYDAELAWQLGVALPVAEPPAAEEFAEAAPARAPEAMRPLELAPEPEAVAPPPEPAPQAPPPAHEPAPSLLRAAVADLLWRHWGCALFALGIILAICLPLAFWHPSPKPQTGANVGTATPPAAPKSTTPAISEPKKKVVPNWPFDAAEARRRQEAAANALGVKVEEVVDLGGGVTLDLVLIPAGEFVIGSSPGERGRFSPAVQKSVSIERPFYMGRHEVTQEQWQAIMGRSSTRFTRTKNPVERVMWHDCCGLLAKLNEKLPGRCFRLPTEAEWEWACRAGAATLFCFGDSDANLGDYAWHRSNSSSRTHPVGEKRPNAWGLHDMHGNVWEWCASPFSDRYDGSESKGEDASAPRGRGRVSRGGSWANAPRDCSSASRCGSEPGTWSASSGFRVGCSVGSSGAPAPTKLVAPVPEPKESTPKDVVKTGGDWPFGAAEARLRQAEAAKALGTSVEQRVVLGGRVSLHLVLIPAGQFVIGSPAGEEGRYPGEDQKTVTIEKPFWMGKHEVTQEQWQAVMGDDAARLTGTKNPVGGVNWDDCRAFLAKLNEKMTGWSFRLPTEAEWEWACRAGAATRFSFVDSDANLGDYAWYDANSKSRTHPVGEKRPNAWALHDMHGSVWEWCASPYAEPYDGSESKGEDAPSRLRVVRGGSWRTALRACRAVRRGRFTPVYRDSHLGFRIACSAGASGVPEATKAAAPEPEPKEPSPKATVEKPILDVPAYLAQWEAPPNVARLLRDVKQEKDWTLRARAAKDLGRAGQQCAINGLIEALRDQEWYVKASAITALADIGDPIALPHISPLTKESLPVIYDQAARACRTLAAAPRDKFAVAWKLVDTQAVSRDLAAALSLGGMEESPVVSRYRIAIIETLALLDARGRCQSYAPLPGEQRTLRSARPPPKRWRR
ncbi:MAG: hypothetical protein FJ290_01135 [Planctomycetes bacterium]|nr:hypothetical protein [Planctomycetota bacterium]